MHSYLRAIGFSRLTRESEVDNLLANVYESFDHRDAVRENDTAFVQMTKDYAPDMGLALCGSLDTEGFHRQYYFPYYRGRGITTSADLAVEKRISGDSFAGICDDGRVGVSLIFYVQNAVRYQKEQVFYSLSGRGVTTTFSGLSTGGMILLPISRNEQLEEAHRKTAAKHYKLMNAAKNGDPEAIENLTIQDMDLYSMVSRRLVREDVFSIVDTFFMPYGMECDQYQIMGNIVECRKVQNEITRENIYQMQVECNDLYFDVCINEKDLMGVPDTGRRFKGSIWLQGRINFAD